MKNVILRNLLVIGMLACTVISGHCQGTFYASRSIFEAALGASTTITFEDVSSLPPPGGLGYGSITNSGVIFATPSSSLYVADPNGDYYPFPGTGKYIWSFDGLTPVSIILPAGMTAFGADFSGGLEPKPSFNATLTVNLVGGASYDYNFSGPRGSWTFFGVSFPQPIANLVYSDGGSFLHEEMLDNVTFGVIPEPSVLGLFGLGALFLGWRLRRKVGR